MKRQSILRKRAKIIKNEDNYKECPECHSNILHDEEHCIDYCTKCGLVTRASTPYIGGHRIDYPYGLLIINE